MFGIRNAFRRWLYTGSEAVPAMTDHSNPFHVNAGAVGSGRYGRNMFEIIKAINGHIVVYTNYTFNPNGSDKSVTELFLVPEGGDLMAAITTAMVSSKLAS